MSAEAFFFPWQYAPFSDVFTTKGDYTDRAGDPLSGDPGFRARHHGTGARTLIPRHTYIDEIPKPHCQQVQSLMRKTRAVPPPVKELMIDLDSHRGSIIIVGAPQLAHRLAQTSHARIVAFSSLEELDEWRESQHDDETFRPDVVAALEEIGCRLSALPVRLRQQLAAVGEKTKVPAMRVLESKWPSRRSFYRMWNESIAETPSAFLRRLRARHAERLIGLGRSKKEAAHLAGYSSVDQMRRNIRK